MLIIDIISLALVVVAAVVAAVVAIVVAIVVEEAIVIAIVVVVVVVEALITVTNATIILIEDQEEAIVEVQVDHLHLTFVGEAAEKVLPFSLEAEVLLEAEALAAEAGGHHLPRLNILEVIIVLMNIKDVIVVALHRHHHIVKHRHIQ